MSNQNVGTVYQQIIKDVIDASRVDFEESGIDENVLEELTKGWQRKLSALAVAQFPWDPKPEPTPAPPPAASNPQPVQHQTYQSQDSKAHIQHQAQTAPTQMAMPSLPPMNPNNNPRIKTEPGLEPTGPPSYPPAPNGMTAQQRAAHMLQANFGARAQAQISQLQGLPQAASSQQGPHAQNMPLQRPMPQQRPTGLQMPPQQPGQQIQQPTGQQQMTQVQYQQAMASQAAASRQQVQNNGAANGGQTDGGADDIEDAAVLGYINPNGDLEQMGRIEIDHLIRRRIESVGKDMEGGGLMLPLHKLTAKDRNANRQRKHTNMAAGPSKAPSRTQMDGPEDDDDDDDDLKAEDEVDEDAINSDLDDPDDALGEDDEDDEAFGNIMLCVYDKVQRVKNKWKCVMKDGVVTINGKDYVFHKASGEYEW